MRGYVKIAAASLLGLFMASCSDRSEPLSEGAIEEAREEIRQEIRQRHFWYPNGRASLHWDENGYMINLYHEAPQEKDYKPLTHICGQGYYCGYDHQNKWVDQLSSRHVFNLERYHAVHQPKYIYYVQKGFAKPMHSNKEIKLADLPQEWRDIVISVQGKMLERGYIRTAAPDPGVNIAPLGAGPRAKP